MLMLLKSLVSVCVGQIVICSVGPGAEGEYPCLRPRAPGAGRGGDGGAAAGGRIVMI